MHEFDDNQLLTLLRNDSLEAYEILFKRYYKMLCLHAALILMDESEAEDMVIELFVEIWDKKIYRKIEQSFKAYLFRCVRNKCINSLKNIKLSKRKQEKYSQYRKEDTVKETSWLEQRELASNINNILLELPAQRLKAFTLVYLEEKRYQEAADEMGLSINSVKTHLKLALRVLRNRLERFR
ncbi:MAG: sigma-70 family RNA polymerase sigma factor [Ginsengibacter sp.]